MTNIDQLVIENDQLVSTGNDSKIFIRFHKPVKELNLDFQLESQDKSDFVELFYSTVNQPIVDFSYNQCYKIGKMNNKEISKNILFDCPVQYIRLDLGNHPGKIKIQKMKICPKKSSYAKTYNEYDSILEEIEDAIKNNIVIVSHALNETGAPILAYNIAKNFLEKKYNVVVIALSDGFLEEKFEELKIPVFKLHQDPLSKEIYNAEVFEGIVKNLSEKGYNQVITNTIISGVTAPFF